MGMSGAGRLFRLDDGGMVDAGRGEKRLGATDAGTEGGGSLFGGPAACGSGPRSSGGPSSLLGVRDPRASRAVHHSRHAVRTKRELRPLLR